MNKYLKNFGSAVLVAFALAPVADALTITPTTGVLNVTRWEGNQTSQPDIDAVIGPIIAPSTLVYTQNVSGGESGTLAGSYTTTFSNTPTDPEVALIVYNVGPIVQPTAYALVKDGSAIPAWFLFNLTALTWNGTDNLMFQDFWPNQGAISHISLYGGSQTVPDGGTSALLLGSAFLAIAFIRRQLFC